MRRQSRLRSLASLLGLLAAAELRAQTLYLDVNSSSGRGTASGTISWNSTTWNDAANGNGGRESWTNGSTAIFNAGGNAYTLNVTSADTTVSGITVSAGSVTITSSGAGTFGLSTDATFNVASGRTLTIATAMSGSGVGLTKTSAGALVLSAANTFSGTTTISAGTLRLEHALALQNSTLSAPASGFSFGTLTAATLGGLTGSGNLALTNTSTQAVALTIGNNDESTTYSGALSGGGSVTKTGSGTLTLAGSSTYTGGTTLNAGTLAVGHNNALGYGALTIAGGTTLSASGGSRTLGNAVAATGNFTIGGTSDLQLTGAVNLGAGDRTVSVVNSGTTTLSGTVSNSYYATTTKTGAGRLVLAGDNTFQGSFVVAEGTVALQHSNALGTAGTWNNVVANGATLELSNNIAVDEAGFTIAGTGVGGAGALHNLSGANTFGGQVLLGDTTTLTSTAGSLTFTGSHFDLSSHTLTVAGAGDTAINGQVSGTGALVKTGAGTLTLSGTNWYSGGTTVSAGTLVGNSSSLPGNVVNNAAVTFDQAATGTYAGTMSGTGTLTKTGAGNLTLGGANTYSGNTTVSEGTLTLANGSALGSGGTTSVTTSATLALQDGITVSTETALNLAGTGDNGTGALRNVSGTNQWLGNIALTGDATITSAAGTLNFGATNTVPGSYSLALGGNTLTFNADGGDFMLRGHTITGTGGIIKEGSGTLLLRNGYNSYTGDTWIKDGTLLIDTYNNYNTGIKGDLIIGDGSGSAQSAVYRQGQTDAPGSANEFIANTSDVTVNADGLWDLRGYAETINNLTLDGGAIVAKNASGAGDRLDVVGTISSTSTTQTATISGRLGLNNAAAKQIDVAAGSTLDVSAIISNGGFDKTGDGTLRLSAINTYAGATKVSDGILNIRHGDALGASSSGTEVLAGAQLQLEGNTTVPNITVANESLTIRGTGISGDGALRSIAGNNTWGGNVTVAGTGGSQIQTDTGSQLTVSGNISGSGLPLTVSGGGDTTFSGTVALNSLTKTGSGTLTVTNTNDYVTANVNGGTYRLGANNILSDGMSINLGSGGTVDVNSRTETVSAVTGSGTLQIASGGTLTTTTLGSSSTSAFTGTLEIASGGLLEVSSALIGTGASGVGSAGTIQLVGSGTFQVADDFTFNGTLEIDTGSLQLSGAGTTFALDTLHITGDATIDFGANIEAFLHLQTLIIDADATLTIVGWTEFLDYFSTHNWADAPYNVQGEDPMTRITFEGYSNTQTVWRNPSWKPYDLGGEIAVPEPRTYGMIFMGATLGLLVWLRRRRRAS